MDWGIYCHSHTRETAQFRWIEAIPKFRKRRNDMRREREKNGEREMNPTSNHGKAVGGGKIAKTVVSSHWVFVLQHYVDMDTMGTGACSDIAGIFSSCFKSPPPPDTSFPKLRPPKLPKTQRCTMYVVYSQIKIPARHEPDARPPSPRSSQQPAHRLSPPIGLEPRPSPPLCVH